MIPSFPRFAPLTLALAAEYQKYVAPHPPYADFHLTNRLCWDVDGSTAVALLNRNLVLRLPDYGQPGSRLTLLGTQALEATVARLLSQSGMTKLDLLPEHVAQQLATVHWKIEEDTDNHDHVLSTFRLTTMEGPELRHFRRAIRTFTRMQGGAATFHRIDPTCPVTQAAILEIFAKRESAKPENNSAYELLALHTFFGLAERVPAVAFGISVHGLLRAFIICEPMADHWMVGHFWKADTTFEGIYSYLMHRTSEYLASRGIEYLNIQQDLGIEGLRAFKHSLAPALYLHKYILRPKPTLQGSGHAHEKVRR